MVRDATIPWLHDKKVGVPMVVFGVEGDKKKFVMMESPRERECRGGCDGGGKHEHGGGGKGNGLGDNACRGATVGHEIEGRGQ